MRLAMILLLFGVLAFIPDQPAAQADTPKRMDGRIEPTTKPGPKYRTGAERLALIRQAMQHQDQVLGKLTPPVTLCKRVPDGSIKIDGKLDDAAWQQATVAADFKLTRRLTAARLPTRAKLLWDAKYLYIAFDCEDTDIIATITEHDGELWREDAAEVFIDVDGDGMSYLEFEVSPRGTFYDASIADYRPEINWPKNMGHLDIDKSIAIYKVHDTRVAAHIDGTLNKSDDKDRGWTCEMAISWSDIRRGTNVSREVPRAGDIWRIGLYRINVKSHEVPDEYAAWSPTTSWFHVPRLFGRVVFVDKPKYGRALQRKAAQK